MSGSTLKHDVFRNPFRTTVVVLCALLVAGFSLAAVLLVNGADKSLAAAEERLGADIVVVPEGAERESKGALLMGVPVQAWMPDANVAQIARVPGVAAASPQLYLATVEGTPYSSSPGLVLVGYDPATDFTVRPWLPQDAGDGRLAMREALGGSFISVPIAGEPITVFGYELTLTGNLEPSGTTLDQSVFVSMETARDILERSTVQAEQTVSIPTESVSSVLVDVAPGFDPQEVAGAIGAQVSGVSAMDGPDLFASFRDQMRGQQTGMITILAVVLALSFAIIVLVFSLVVNERRREIGVLRALGATRNRVVRSLLASASLLAMGGGVVGVVVSGLTLYFFRNRLAGALGYPFEFPSLGSFVLFVVVGLAVALAGVLLAASIPAYRISRQDPALSMRR